MRTMNETQINAELRHFTGTEYWYRHEIYRLFTFTDGVLFLAEAAGASWLIDRIFSLQYEVPALKVEEFQFWTLTVRESVGTLTCEDGNGGHVYTITIKCTDDFPLSEIKLWFKDNVLFLPSEY